MDIHFLNMMCMSYWCCWLLEHHIWAAACCSLCACDVWRVSYCISPPNILHSLDKPTKGSRLNSSSDDDVRDGERVHASPTEPLPAVATGADNFNTDFVFPREHSNLYQPGSPLLVAYTHGPSEIIYQRLIVYLVLRTLALMPWQSTSRS